MKRSIAFLAIIFIALSAIAEEPHHSLVRVKIQNEAEVARLAMMDMDIATVSPGRYVEIVAVREDISALQSAGFETEIVIADMEKFYAEQNANGEPMGGFYTYSEMVDRMNWIHNTYPNLTTAPFSIGQSWENRDLWVMKVSDNPGLDENEPEVWYDGMHHAREPITMQLLLYFIEYLMTNYGVDSLATLAVNERELFFCPCTNPDGYVYNQTTNPNGGGMWRKNRRNNGGSYGVDINRNYPYDWGHDNVGSSPTPSSETYRGPYPASEPEVQAIIAFINTRHFILSHSYHSYGDLCMYPWASEYNGLTPDNATFVQLGNQISSYNGYSVGTVWQLLYDVNGGSIDWHYGGQGEHYKILALTQEVGASFWPASNLIQGLCQENVLPNLYSALVVEDYPIPNVCLAFVENVIDDTVGGNGNGSADPGESLDLTVNLRNTGLGTATGINGQLVTLDPYITITTAVSAYPNLNSLAMNGNNTPFHLSISNTCPVGHTAMLFLSVSAGGGYTDTLAVELLVGDPLNQPTGPDQYGYMAYDQFDGHPMGTFEWVELDPVYGGNGNVIAFTADDQTVQQTLPFTFQYYGQDFTQVSINTNGWVAMGVTTSTDHSNSAIPNPDGPPNMIAPFWEDLSPQASGHVCYYYDATNHRYIVEFSRVRQYTPTTAFETFEVILYDPTFYATWTGDGIIKYQYLIVTDPTSCTVGIENSTQTIGLQVLYNTNYNANSHTIDDSATIVFTTGVQTANLTITLTPVNPPIVIPAGGGSFSYQLQITNNGPNPTTFDGWLQVLLPTGSTVLILNRPNITLGVGAVLTRNMTQTVPGTAPAGAYVFYGRVGNYPTTIIDQDSIPFVKTGIDATAGGSWEAFGWDGEVDLGIPTEFALNQNYPNPFNPETTIEFALPSVSNVKLAVYNVKGQEIAVLSEGYYSAGYYNAVWNAEGFSSGIYFFRLDADNYTAIKKCLLLK